VLEGGDIFVHKGADLLADPNMPLLFVDGRSPAVNLFGAITDDNFPLNEASQSVDFRRALLSHVRDMRLTHWFYLDRPFQCPFATECDVAKDTCASGIRAFADMPDDARCLVRSALRESGFSIRRPGASV